MDIKVRAYKVGPYDISPFCMETYPCQHDVTFPNGDVKTMCARDIYEMLHVAGLECEHFDYCKNWVDDADDDDNDDDDADDADDAADLRENYDKVGPYQISHFCYLTSPCKHNVIFPDGTRSLMLATNIYKLLQQAGQMYPHFDYCKEIIRKREQPTPEETAERLVREAKTKANMERQQKECDELKALVNRTKASSRLDKLRAANSIK